MKREPDRSLGSEVASTRALDTLVLTSLAFACASAGCGPIAGHHPGAGGSAGTSSGNEHLVITVSDSNDSGQHSLRAAITKANRTSTSRLTDITIRIAESTYDLSQCGDGEDSNQTGDLDILVGVPITLVSMSGTSTIRQVCPNERVIDHHGAGTLRLTNVILTGGTASAGAGGGVRAAGDLVLEHATVSTNFLAGDEQGARGGGVYVGGALRASDTLFSNNGVSGPGANEGGAAYVVGAVTVSGGTIESNRASSSGLDARGGGIAQAIGSTEPLVVDGTTFTGNTAQGATAAPAATDASTTGATGGALAASGALRIQNVTATGNAALAGGVASAETAITVSGVHPLSFSGGPALGGALAAASDASLVNSVFSDNRVTSSSQGSRSLVLAVPGCTPGQPGCYPCWSNASPSYAGSARGGAIWIGHEGRLDGGTYERNSAHADFSTINFCTGTICAGSYPECASPPPPSVSVNGSGGVLAVDGPLVVTGGTYTGNGASHSGMAIDGTSDADVASATFQDNVTFEALRVAGHLSAARSQFLGNGAGVHAASLEANGVTIANSQRDGIDAASASLVNVSLSGNGGTAVATSELTVDQSTFVDNAANMTATSPSIARSVIVARAGTAICAPGTRVAASSYNWFSDESCDLSGTGDEQSNAAFDLGPLADNGGPVQTLLPGPNSVLLDRIPPAACPVAVDARGVTRPQGSGCDVGAVEVERPVP